MRSGKESIVPLHTSTILFKMIEEWNTTHTIKKGFITMLKITNIKWDITDGAEDTTPEENLEILESLPKEVYIKVPYTNNDVLENDKLYNELCEEISDYLSNEYGFCHSGFDVEVVIALAQNLLRSGDLAQ